MHLEESLKTLNINCPLNIKANDYSVKQNNHKTIVADRKSSAYQRPPFSNKTNLLDNKLQSLSPQEKYQNTIETYKQQIQHMRDYLKEMEARSITPVRKTTRGITIKINENSSAKMSHDDLFIKQNNNKYNYNENIP